MVILKQLPDDSALKNALREDWSEDKYIQVGILNELRIMRADNAAFNQNEMQPVLIKSPSQQAEDLANEQEQLAVRTGILSQLNRR